MSEYGAPVQYGPDGQQVYLVHEWQPGVDIVQGGLVDGAPVLTPVQDMGHGVRAVYDPSRAVNQVPFEVQHQAGLEAARRAALAASADTDVNFLLLLS